MLVGGTRQPHAPPNCNPQAMIAFPLEWRMALGGCSAFSDYNDSRSKLIRNNILLRSQCRRLISIGRTTTGRPTRHPCLHTMSDSLVVRQLLFLVTASTVTAWQWPNPLLQSLDDLRWDQAGAHGGVLGNSVSPCNQFDESPTGNQTSAAQWLRTVRFTLAYVQRRCLADHSGIPRHVDV
jgi:hypothetical protein